MHPLRFGRELRAHLANAIAQGDDRVEPLRDELVKVLRAVTADVDATPSEDANGIRMKRFRMASSAGGSDDAA
jgi:hypothetical protein